MVSETHIIALVKGALEGDPEKHFGSLLGFDEHLRDAAQLGLVRCETGSYDVEVTDAGREFYESQRLFWLPPGRANAWRDDDPVLKFAIKRLGELEEAKNRG